MIRNFYDTHFKKLVDGGTSGLAAAESTATAYLDGKPALRGKHKITNSERHAAFWSSNFLTDLPQQAWASEAMTLALAQYMRQERVSNTVMLASVAAVAPDALIRAVRCSGLVLMQHSSRRTELDQLAVSNPAIAELCKVLDIFDVAHRERTAEVLMWQNTLAELSPLELLCYASLHAFEHWVPKRFGQANPSAAAQANRSEDWGAVNDILLWKLADSADDATRLTDAVIGSALAKHLAPFLFPSSSGAPARHDLREAFANLLAAQTEVNSFVAQSADAFSYDNSIEFVRLGDRLEINVLDAASRVAWDRNGRKLSALHNYWYYRAMDAFVDSGMATERIGSPENHELNRVAYIKALRTQLQLTEVYGVSDAVSTDAGDAVPLLQALLSLELMNVFFQRDFLEAFVKHLRSSGDWAMALSMLVFNGLRDGNQNRLPLTWSSRDDKVAKMVGWTVTAVNPKGNPRHAAAIVDFWTSDWSKLATQLRDGAAGSRPELFERPILRMGQTLVQLPWVVGLQNNSTAAINNLRRLGMRRNEARAETQQIEIQLGATLEKRGFKVVLNWNPPVSPDGNAGEVDVICARDGVVLVLEVKSTYLRRSQQDAWRHANTTLRKAGQQLQRKVAAVQLALGNESGLAPKLAQQLEIGAPTTPMYGWIVDTSIECDHQRFGGFLKISLEELLIALRDDRHLLHDPDDLFGQPSQVPHSVPQSLYPQGFSALRLMEVVEAQAVWHGI
ncbi:MAG: NERD domain-containing protein [Burkholderiaceae bacterium]|nr:NERD domain-containing protein [Burkholderiaceae bacterium]